MRIMKLALVALLAAVTLVPTSNSAASAQSNFFRRMLPQQYNQPAYNGAYNPYNGYNPYAAVSPYYGYDPNAAANTAAAAATAVKAQQTQAFVNQVNSAVAAGQITLFEGNAILIRGHW